MLMSIFSSFDNLSAEPAGHKRVEFSWSPAKRTAVDGTDGKAAPAKGKSGSSASETPQADAKIKRLNAVKNLRRQRFAPELDGVHCFETIIPC